MIKRHFKLFLAIIVAIVIISLQSCNSTRKWEKQEETDIQNYVLSHSTVNYIRKESGLYYTNVIVGTGSPAIQHDTAYVLYSSYFLSGTPYNSNIKSAAPHDTLKFPIAEGKTIQGFDEAITYMNAGGKSMIIVPSYLGFGESGYYMTPYTPLLYTIILCRVVHSSTK
jgi:FKBP-type peptidyl-prolyl cis-trans isomerase FkpA